MNPIRRIRRLATVLAGLAAALAAFGVPPALAVRPPGPGAPGVTTPPGTITPPVEVHTVVVGGMPGWQIALIAVVARSEERRVGKECSARDTRYERYHAQDSQ